jgi:hypothetical protein
MPILREAMRMAPMAIVAVAIVYAVTGRDAAPATRVGSATLTVADDTARMVERVAYNDVVERVGDVVIEAGQPMAPIDQSEVALAWAIVDEVWPTNRRDDLVQLSVIREDSLGLVGVVHLASDGGWILSLDAADLERRDIMVETIVHELAHVVTLSPDRFSFTDTGDCDGVSIELGCARGGSALARFHERFWPDGRSVDDRDDSFVTPYAGSAVHEDLAETFTAWVFDWPVGGSELVAQKIALLAADAELAALREDLVGLARSS